jgi:hypothetical protein
MLTNMPAANTLHLIYMCGAKLCAALVIDSKLSLPHPCLSIINTPQKQTPHCLHFHTMITVNPRPIIDTIFHLFIFFNQSASRHYRLNSCACRDVAKPLLDRVPWKRRTLKLNRNFRLA